MKKGTTPQCIVEGKILGWRVSSVLLLKHVPILIKTESVLSDCSTVVVIIMLDFFNKKIESIMMDTTSSVCFPIPSPIPALRTIYHHWINPSRKHKKPRWPFNLVKDA